MWAIELSLIVGFEVVSSVCVQSNSVTKCKFINAIKEQYSGIQWNSGGLGKPR